MDHIKLELANWPEYELIDSGNGKKFERFGKYTIARPENQALWKARLSEEEWSRADIVFERTDSTHGQWHKAKNVPSEWEISHSGIKFFLRLTPFGHVGVFPEQSPQWEWIDQQIKHATMTGLNPVETSSSLSPSSSSLSLRARENNPLKILSLFTYTGISTLTASNAGASVVHIDASGPAITWARENAKLSGLENKPIRWIVEDAIKFVKREERRGNTYDGIIMDPPKFGRGPKGEVWKFEDSFQELLDSCRKILVHQPSFLLVTAYNVPVSSMTLHNMADDTMRSFSGDTESGELGIKDRSGRILSNAIYARWKRKT